MIDTKAIRDVVATTGGDQYPIIPLCDRIDELERKLEIAENLLHELHVMVWGECPQLLNEDSGGDADLDFKIVEALKQIRGD